MNSLKSYLLGEGYLAIPLKKVVSGHYKLKVKVNQNEAFFILDTGASNSCMAKEYCIDYQLNFLEDMVQATGAGKQPIDTLLSKNNTLTIGNLSLKKIQFILLNMDHINNAFKTVEEEPVQGILGANHLKKLRAVIDYRKNHLYIKK